MLSDMRNMLGNERIKISFDEWSTWYAWYRPENVFDGIFAVSMIHLIIKASEPLGAVLPVILRL